MKQKKSKKTSGLTKNNDTKNNMSLFFSKFAEKIAEIIGHPLSFFVAISLIIIWLVAGPYFQYSDTWQLVVNTGTTIITFLIVFLIQNTQNRDTKILNLKLDEMIRAHKGSKNSLIDLTKLSDGDLKKLEAHYMKLCSKITGN